MNLKNTIQNSRYFRSLKFAFYCMTHPIDGYWDLTHEKRGTLGAATTILILTLLTRVAKLQFSGFIVMKVNWEEINIFLYFATIIFPLALWCIGNWGMTTLFDGKGRLWQIYMATCYGMLPYVVIQIPLMIISNFMTENMVELYGVVDSLSIVWCAFLIIMAMGQIHDYKLWKTITFTFATIFAVLVIVFILLLFFGMISSGVSYFISLGKEAIFRYS
ncbi:MAG: YIP1 family protein [Lachnospiraceae bacterium]|nr:YIP1 family protein [Lachnospiraceae bacterium]